MLTILSRRWLAALLMLCSGVAMAEVPEPSYEPTYQAVETGTFWLRMAPVAGGKMLQPVTLVPLAGGEELIAAYRPVKDYFSYIDRKVVVTGRRYVNSPFVQSVGGTHFEIQKIALAPGQAPLPLVPGPEMPTPKQVRTLAELKANAGAYVTLVGQLTAATREDHLWALEMKLPDGVIKVKAPGAVTRGPVKAPGEFTLVLQASAAPEHCAWFCAGNSPRCGMKTRGKRKARP